MTKKKEVAARRETENTAARRQAEDTAARREPLDLDDEARAQKLNHVLSSQKCVHCGQSAWFVTSTRGRLRYVRCRGCQRTAKLLEQADGKYLFRDDAVAAMKKEAAFPEERNEEEGTEGQRDKGAEGGEGGEETGDEAGEPEE